MPVSFQNNINVTDFENVWDFRDLNVNFRFKRTKNYDFV